MNKRKYIILIIILLIFASCKEKSSEAKEVAAIKVALTDMWEAIEKHDTYRYAKNIHPDFTQFGETDSVLMVGKSAEVNAIKEWLQHTSNVHTDMVEPRITIKGNVAWIVYYWSDNGSIDGKHFSSRGKSTRIFVKEEDRWLCIHGHYTLLP
jgi:ketosteroid isomerase-like protein